MENSVNWTATGFRLPTEAEWEYAAPGGQNTRNFIYAGSDDLDSVGWYSENAGSRTQAVGGLKANELGLFDMSGNLWEWCWDWYADDYYASFNSILLDPQGPKILRIGFCAAGFGAVIPVVRASRIASGTFRAPGVAATGSGLPRTEF